MKRPEFLRPAYFVFGAVAAALAGWLVRADSWQAKLAMVLFAGVFFAYGAWSMREVWSVLVEIAQGIGDWWRRRRVPASHVHTGPLPELPPATQAKVRKAVAVMAAHGLFKPEVPDAALLFAGLARTEGRARPDDILFAMQGVAYYHPGAKPEAWMANLVQEEFHAEQFEDALQRQVEDIVRLSEGALQVEDLHISLNPRAGVDDSRDVQVQVHMAVNGQRVELDYPGHLKSLSTHVQHALAKRLASQGNGRRLAWLYMGESICLSVLKDGAVEALNRELRLGPRSACQWAWVDEQEPVDASVVDAPPP
jgi:hypothetical protein